jgi:cytochrome c oxidase subunit 4
MSHHDKRDQSAHIKLYLMVFGALLVLTLVTVGVSYLNLPKSLGIPLGLAIATLKASLVAAFFMHLKGERTLIYGLLGLTVVATIILFALPITDSVAIRDRIIQHPVAAESGHQP